MSSPHELDACVLKAVKALPQTSKADFLLNTAVAMLEGGQYGDDVETYLDVLLRTPGIPPEHLARALMARGEARRSAGQQLLDRAEQDFKAVLRLDPTHRGALAYVRRDFPALKHDPRRLPRELWELVASHTPRFHMRQWLSLSRFHRAIAQRAIFRTLDIFFSEDSEIITRVMDIFERVKQDREFASLIKTLRLHWSMEEGDLLDLLIRIFRGSVPCFTGLQEFEWIGYPEMGPECVQTMLETHPQLQRLGLIGWHFDAVGVSAFTNLRKFTLRAEDDDGFADMGEVRAVVDKNERTLRHLSLGASLNRYHSWDEVFESPVIQNLTRLDLVDTRISHSVLTRIAHAPNITALTLHGTFDEPAAATVIFGSDHIVGGRHTLLPLLEEFRCVLVGHDDDAALLSAIAIFARGRPRLTRLDLGSCPWELVLASLRDLPELRALRIKTGFLPESAMRELVRVLPQGMTAIHLAATTIVRPLSEHAHEFTRFPRLGMLHLNALAQRRPQPNTMSERDFHTQTDAWYAAARGVAIGVASLDFVGWHREHYAVVRGEHGAVELKELPVRRRLDCGKGVDLGTEDAMWMERKDVPLDWETPGLECVS